MGARITKDEIKCFDEIRFILVAFRNKYEDNVTVPKYGLNNIISDLGKKDKTNWRRLQEFIRHLNSWRIDSGFIMSIETTVHSDFDKAQILATYIKDVVMLEDKIKEIVDKYKKDNSKLVSLSNTI